MGVPFNCLFAEAMRNSPWGYLHQRARGNPSCHKPSNRLLTCQFVLYCGLYIPPRGKWVSRDLTHFLPEAGELGLSSKGSWESNYFYCWGDLIIPHYLHLNEDSGKNGVKSRFSITSTQNTHTLLCLKHSANHDTKLPLNWLPLQDWKWQRRPHIPQVTCSFSHPLENVVQSLNEGRHLLSTLNPPPPFQPPGQPLSTLKAGNSS